MAFRGLCVVVVLLSLAGCRAKHATGAFAAQGVAAGELAKGDRVYSCWESDGGRCNYAGVVCGLGPTSARICATARSTEGRTLTLAQLIPEQRLAPGMLLEDRASRAWQPITHRYSDGLGVDEEGHSIPWADVIVVTQTAQAYDHHERWFNTIAGALLTLSAIGMLVFARRLQKRAAAHERAADLGDDDGAETENDKAAAARTAAAADGKLDVLRCDACATPIKLVAEPQTVCPGCNKQIAIPPAYVDLVQKQRYIAEHLPGQAAALRRAQIMANPVVAVLMLAAGYGAWKGFGWIMGHMTGGNDAAFWVVTAFPLFYLPVGCLVAAIGQLAGGRVLARAVPESRGGEG